VLVESIAAVSCRSEKDFRAAARRKSASREQAPFHVRFRRRAARRGSPGRSPQPVARAVWSDAGFRGDSRLASGMVSRWQRCQQLSLLLSGELYCNSRLRDKVALHRRAAPLHPDTRHHDVGARLAPRLSRRTTKRFPEFPNNFGWPTHTAEATGRHGTV
jgi:hypothetical protein